MTHKLFFELCIEALHWTPTTIQLEELPKEYWDKAIEVMKECLELGVTDALRISASFSVELDKEQFLTYSFNSLCHSRRSYNQIKSKPDAWASTCLFPITFDDVNSVWIKIKDEEIKNKIIQEVNLEKYRHIFNKTTRKELIEAFPKTYRMHMRRKKDLELYSYLDFSDFE